jgi:AraC-like DNA-binding protein
MSTDTLSDVLRAVRLTGACFFDVHATAPWVAETPSAREITHLIMPGSDHVIEYHLLVSGSCYGGLTGEASERLEAGDLIIFPQGDPHVMSSAPGMRAVPDLSEFRRPQGEQLPFTVQPGGGGDPATLVCGFLGCDARPFNPLLATLPRVILVRREQLADRPLQSLIQVAVAESRARRAGSECVLARLSELLFVEAVRLYVETIPPEQSGWLAGLRDPHVGRALAALHDRPGHAWTLDDLAQEVGLSRSLLAERFQHFVGHPPMQYLAKWRMQLAAERLRNTTDTIAEIADRIGYGSESAFSRAFKRLVGIAPNAFREGESDGETPERGESSTSQ